MGEHSWTFIARDRANQSQIDWGVIIAKQSGSGVETNNFLLLQQEQQKLLVVWFNCGGSMHLALVLRFVTYRLLLLLRSP